jgi:type VI secretion system protein ImpH
LPDRPALRKLVSLIRAFLGFQTGFAINPVLAAGAVPALQLDHGRETQPRLGWNTWLPMASQRRRDAADAVFTAEMAESTSPKVCRP